jgi:hypothetical protein
MGKKYKFDNDSYIEELIKELEKQRNEEEKNDKKWWKKFCCFNC